MKKWLGVLVCTFLAVGSITATADPGHERPKITTLRFAQKLVNAGVNETLVVIAHDPDSWIYEVQAQWEDEDHSGGALFAHTGCVQDPDFSDPGTPAKLKLPVQFDHPGIYHLEVRALSAFECRPGEDEKTSRVEEMEVTVRDPLETFADADDASGAFDIASIEQTQRSSDTSATTEIVHRISMFDAWNNDALAGAAFMEMQFDLDGDPTTSERTLTIDLDESDGTLRASMLDATTGQSRGYAAITRPDDRTIEVRIPPLLLKRGIDDYRWYAFVDSGAPELCSPDNPCVDRAPDEEMVRHRL